MPARTTGKPRRGTRRGRSATRSVVRTRRLRVVWALGLVAISVYLYYRPLASYFETRADLAEARTQVTTLQESKERLEQRLAFSTSEEAARREARRIGYVRAGEQLFIVKGIPAWRRAHMRSLRGDG